MYIPPTGGYIHLGDVAANFAALAFGPWVGMVASGVGMAIADAIGFPLYIVPTLLIHGLQGLVVGLLGWRRPLGLKVAAAVLGQLIVIAGYFVTQIALGYGTGAALFEVPWNALQGLVGVIGGVALFLLVERAYPPISELGRVREWREDEDLD
jgi:energy-coupling factor transport system substrate-specific component